MKKLFFLITLIVIILLINSRDVYAAEIAAGSSAKLNIPLDEKVPDSRGLILKEFLEKYNSPLVPFADDFVEIADKYELDWRLVAAISGVESTFGKNIPANSYNAWGWGIYGNNVIRFSSWSEGIEIVSKGLRENYFDKGATSIYQVGRIYAESKAWPYRVDYFMEKIDEFKTQFEANNQIDNLSISL